MRQKQATGVNFDRIQTVASPAKTESRLGAKAETVKYMKSLYYPVHHENLVILHEPWKKIRDLAARYPSSMTGVLGERINRMEVYQTMFNTIPVPSDADHGKEFLIYLTNRDHKEGHQGWRVTTYVHDNSRIGVTRTFFWPFHYPWELDFVAQLPAEDDARWQDPIKNCPSPGRYVVFRYRKSLGATGAQHAGGVYQYRESLRCQGASGLTYRPDVYSAEISAWMYPEEITTAPINCR